MSKKLFPTGNLFSLTLSIVLVFTGCENDQISSVQSEFFLKFFGSYSVDYGNDLIVVDDAYIFTGTETTRNSGKDMLVVKTDEYGNEDWKEYFNVVSDDFGNAIQEVRGKGYLILGTATDKTGDTDVMLIMLSYNGKLVWEKIYDNQFNDEAQALRILNDGYLILGNTNASGNIDIMLLKTDTAGDQSWKSIYGGLQDDFGNDVLVTKNGFIIVGSTNSFKISGQDNNNIILVKTSLEGGLLDNVTYGGLSDDYGNAVVSYENGLVICGTTQSLAQDGSDMVLLKIRDDYRTVEWEKVFGNEGNDQGMDVLVANNEIVAVGSNEVTGGISSGYLVKVDGEGNLLRENNYGGVGNFVINTVKPTPDQGFVFLGTSTFEQNSMIILAKTNSDGKLEK